MCSMQLRMLSFCYGREIVCMVSNSGCCLFVMVVK